MGCIAYDYTQADWGHKHPRPFVKHTPIRVELHHSVIPAARYSTVDHARVIQRMHLNKGWNGIFYNVGVNTLNGEIIECRGEGNLSTSDARDALTVCCFADLRTDRITPAASDALLSIIDCYSQTPRGHRERPYPTACPANHGIEWLDAYRSGRIPLPKPPPPPQEFKDMAQLIYAVRPDTGKRTAAYITGGATKRKCSPEEAQWHALVGLIESAVPQERTWTYFESIPTVQNV